MPRRTLLVLSLAALLALGLLAPAAQAAVPSWARPAVRYLADKGILDRDTFRANRSMSRAAFSTLMVTAFGPGHYLGTTGKVTAGEVDTALVKALGYMPLARKLRRMTSPDGWSPRRNRRFGTEIMARELGLRYNRPTTEEQFEAAAGDPLRQADIAYAVWKARVAPNTWAATELEGFSLPDYNATARRVLQFAMAQVGQPYYWSGEWTSKTPAGYPFGAQSAAGVDCSGFVWYVLQKKTTSYSPDRDYEGWSLPQRSSADMAGATKMRIRYRDLKPADVLLFASGGRGSDPSTVYHAGLYMGNGWMIDSTGSQAGVSLSYIGSGSWWRSQLVFGRRVVR